MGCPPGTGQLSTSGHLCPSATLPLCPHLLVPTALLQGSCTATLPTSLCLQLSVVGVCTHFPLPHPKGALSAKHLYLQPRIPSLDPALWGYFASPLSVHTSPHPCNVKVELGCLGQPAGHCPGVTARLGGAEHAALGVRVLPCLGAVGVSTTSATPALFRRGVNQFCTGTSSCYYWELEDWNNPHVRGGELVPSAQVLSSSRTGVRNKSVSFLLRGTHRSLCSLLAWEGLGDAAGLRSQFSSTALAFRALMQRAVAGCDLPDPFSGVSDDGERGYRSCSAGCDGVKSCLAGGAAHFQPRAPPGLSRPWVGKRCFLCIC